MRSDRAFTLRSLLCGMIGAGLLASLALSACGPRFVASCDPQCPGDACGPDGCGGTCGACAGDAAGSLDQPDARSADSATDASHAEAGTDASVMDGGADRGSADVGADAFLDAGAGDRADAGGSIHCPGSTYCTYLELTAVDYTCTLLPDDTYGCQPAGTIGSYASFFNCKSACTGGNSSCGDQAGHGDARVMACLTCVEGCRTGTPMACGAEVAGGCLVDGQLVACDCR